MRPRRLRAQLHPHLKMGELRFSLPSAREKKEIATCRNLRPHLHDVGK